MKLIYYILTLFALLAGFEFAYGANYQTGLRMPKDWARHAKFSSLLGVDLPESFDWREKVTLPQVKNQGQCGSCWAFATTEVEEHLIAIAENKIVTLSPQELVSCDSQSYGCGGGYFSAFDYEKQKGLAYEKDFPYRAANTRCTTGSLAHDYRIFDWGYVGGANRRPTVNEIKAAIVSSGPLAVTVCADNRFMNYRSGIFSGRAGCQNHMVTLVSYDDATQTWGLQNSWGTGWGEKGFMRIKWGSNSVAEIAAFAVYHPEVSTAESEVLTSR